MTLLAFFVVLNETRPGSGSWGTLPHDLQRKVAWTLELGRKVGRCKTGENICLADTGLDVKSEQQRVLDRKV